MNPYFFGAGVMAVTGVFFLFVLTWQWALAMFGASASLFFLGMSRTADGDGHA